MTRATRTAWEHPNQYVSINEAAQWLSVDDQTIRRKIAAGEIPAFKIGQLRRGALKDTRPIRIPVDALESLLHPVTLAGGDAA